MTTKKKETVAETAAREEMELKRAILKEIQEVLEKHNAALVPILTSDNRSIRADAVIEILKEVEEVEEETTTQDEKGDN